MLQLRKFTLLYSVLSATGTTLLSNLKTLLNDLSLARGNLLLFLSHLHNYPNLWHSSIISSLPIKVDAVQSNLDCQSTNHFNGIQLLV